MTSSEGKSSAKNERWLYWGAWFIAIALVAIAVYLGWRVINVQASTSELPTPAPPVDKQVDQSAVSLPNLPSTSVEPVISRRMDLHTIIPTRSRKEIQEYTVDTGDSVFAIANAFGLKPESVLWANYDSLKDNPDQLSPGMELIIPPEDGVLYEWNENDTLQGVAEKFKAESEAILGWSGNKLDLTNPVIAPGTLVMIPGGQREFQQWVIPTIPRGRAGVSSSLLGGGACEGGYEGAYGTGGFIWPADNHTLSGNDYWSGHLAIDIAAGEGAHIYASDSGVVVFAGSAFGGYGNMVVIDHGNGYQTLYAHLSSVGAHCGQSALQGQYIGTAGSTGNSTGPHLHFEIRYLGGFINPWYVLP